MLSFEGSLVRGTPWTSKVPTIFTATIAGAEEGPSEARVEIQAAFRAHRIPMGGIVRTEISIGCTGAHFRIEVDGGEFSNWHEGSTVEIEYNISRKRKASMSAKTQGLGLSVEQGADATAGFVGVEHSVAAVRVSRQVVEWICELHRAELAIRDYLVGNLNLWAICSVQDRVDVRSFAKPRDRRFFGSDNRALSRLASIGVYARLRAQNVHLPEVDTVSHQMQIVRTQTQSDSPGPRGA
jgi:hypothetical protein